MLRASDSGSCRQVCTVTRKGFAHAMVKTTRVMDLFGALPPWCQKTTAKSYFKFCRGPRPTQKILKHTQHFFTYLRVLVIRERDNDYRKGRPGARALYLLISAQRKRCHPAS
jgi:hypothetical protein